MRLVEGVCGEMRTWAQIGLMAAGMVTLGCTEGRSADPGEWTLSDGRGIAELTLGDSVVVLAVDPSQCLRCSSVLAEWLEWERSTGSNVWLLLTREPTEGERHILLATGIRTDGQLAGVRIEAQRTPVELVVDTGGVIVRTEQVYGPSSPLLDALDDGKSLQEAVAELTAYFGEPPS